MPVPDGSEALPTELTTAEFVQRKWTHLMGAWSLRRALGARWVLVILAVFTSAFAYRYLVDWMDENNEFNFYSDVARVLGQEEYHIFTGSEGGFYIEIGQALENRTLEDGRIKFINEQSNGALNNARNVASHAKTFGLVQEDTLKRDDFLREHIRYVSPLYLERMLILYDADAFKKSGASDQDGARFVLSNSKAAQDMFEHDDIRISKGPVGSGSRLFASHVLAECGIESYNDLSLSFADGLRRLTLDVGDPEKVDVVFNITGAPLDSVQNVLEEKDGKRFRLMSIDPSMLSRLNERHDLKMKNASYKDKYENGEEVSTFGTWSFLIASKDISNDVVLDALAELNDAKDAIRMSIGLSKNEDDNFQLSEFNFYETFRGGHTEFRTRFARNSLLFAAFVSTSSSVIVAFLSWLISAYNKVKFYRELTSIHGDLPENANLEKAEEGEVPRPVIYTDQKEIISSIIRGMSRLLSMARQVRISYDGGELRMGHYSLLLSNIDNLRAILQRNLSQRLNEYYANYGAFDAATLRHYYTAGYLSMDGVRDLDARYGAVSDLLPSASPEGERDSADEVELVLDPMGEDAPRAFISYRHEDSDFAAGRIRERIVEQFGPASVFQDSDMLAGHDFRDIIEREIAHCDVVLAIIGPQWTSILKSRTRNKHDDYVRIELEIALAHGIPIVPVLLAPAQVPHERDVPESIREVCYRHAVTVRPDPEFQASADRLITALHEASQHADETRPRTTRKPAATRKQNAKADSTKTTNGKTTGRLVKKSPKPRKRSTRK
jgi:TRAP-type uncharacterized transport system substrate-binding protein